MVCAAAGTVQGDGEFGVARFGEGTGPVTDAKSFPQTPVKAAMPQLVPFFFVNEVVFACTIIPLLVYIFSKYILPQRLRLFATRLFISKL